MAVSEVTDQTLPGRMAGALMNNAVLAGALSELVRPELVNIEMRLAVSGHWPLVLESIGWELLVLCLLWAKDCSDR